MPVDIRVPELGESVVEATVGRWLKREGEPVAAGEPVVELETEKVNVELPAEQGGSLGKILKREGETVRPGDVLGTIAPGIEAQVRQPSGQVRQPSGQVRQPSGIEKPAGGQAVAAPPQPAAPRTAAQPTAAPPTPAAAEWRPTSPAVREVAAEHGVELARVPGTGRGGRVTVEDVLRHARQAEPETPVARPTVLPIEEAEAGQPTPAEVGPAEPVIERPAGPARRPPSPGEALAAELLPTERREERVRLSRRRQTIARRLMEAQQTTASLTTFNEVDVSALQELRKRRGEAFHERHGVKLGLMSFFTKAAVAALKAFPQLNAELQGDELVLKRYYDVGIAVSTKGGLVVPVVRDADRKSFAELEKEIESLATRARENELTLAELLGGTFTITNGGVFGSLFSTPILNVPQVGILGMHKIEDRPVAVNGQIAVRPMMYLALTYDHRVVDGREAVEFLVRVKTLIEDPEALLLEG